MLKLLRRKTEYTSEWKKPEGMPVILYRLLLSRGIESDADYDAYRETAPDKLWNQLRNPFELNDMGKAVELIQGALDRGERICVYGDYDCDGICASAILKLYLESAGAKDTLVYLPSRHDEGYGLNEDAIDKIAQECRLLVTVDTGITAKDMVKHARDKGMNVVITDHHREDPENTPKDAEVPLVNPLLGSYPFRFLCGAGVAFQLVTALAAGTPDNVAAGREKVKQYVDFAALATIADIVTLQDENRAIAKLGIMRMNAEMRPGLKALIEAAALSIDTIDSSAVAFKISPRINASGRMDNAKLAFDLLTGTDPEKCTQLALGLNEKNRERREEEEKVMQSAEKRLESYDFDENRVVIIEGEDWHKGVIGLASSRIAEKYRRPAVVLTRDGDCYIGSCRSLGEMDIQAALSCVSDLLERFGGHKLAAGLKLKADRLPEFRRRLNDYFKEKYVEAGTDEAAVYDVTADAGDLTQELVEQLSVCEPVGCDNPAPVLRVNGKPGSVTAVGPGKLHLKLDFTDAAGTRLPCIWYRRGDAARTVSSCGHACLLMAPKLNRWQGKTTVQAEVQRIIDDEQLITWGARLLISGAEPQAADDLPGREELLAIWRACKLLGEKKVRFADETELLRSVHTRRKKKDCVEWVLKGLRKDNAEGDFLPLIEGKGNPVSCALGILVLSHAGIVTIEKAGRLSLSVKDIKTNPLEDELYTELAKTNGDSNGN